MSNTEWPRSQIKEKVNERSSYGCGMVVIALIAFLIYLPILAVVLGFSWRLFLYTCGC